MENFTLEFEDKNIDVPFRATSCKVSDLLEHERSLLMDKLDLINNKYKEPTEKLIKANLEREELESKGEWTATKQMQMDLDHSKENMLLLRQNEDVQKVQREFYISAVRHILNFKNLVTAEKEIVKTEEFWKNQDHEKAKLALDFFINRNKQIPNE